MRGSKEIVIHDLLELGGSEIPRRGRRKLQRGRRPGEYRPLRQGNHASAGTDSQEEQGFEVGEAGGKSRLYHPRPRMTGK
jgi:hypothetical protein